MPALPLTIFCAAVLVLFRVPSVCAFETTYWVWHRTAPPTREETQILTGHDVRKLYWHAGTLRTEGEGWRSNARLELPAKSSALIALVPVLRLAADNAPAFGDVAAASI